MGAVIYETIEDAINDAEFSYSRAYDGRPMASAKFEKLGRFRGEIFDQVPGWKELARVSLAKWAVEKARQS